MNDLMIQNGMDNQLSNWKKPGGTLGKIVAGLGIGGGIYLLSKALPFLIGVTTNLLHLTVLLVSLFAIIALISSKKFRKVFSLAYFMVMRKITGIFIETDPIAIVEHHLKEMKDKCIEITENLSKLQGYNVRCKNRLDEKKHNLELEIKKSKLYREKGMQSEATVSDRQIDRLARSIENQSTRLEQSLKWHKILMELRRVAVLTVTDTENEVMDRKEEYEAIKAQHKAFKSIMSLVRGDHDDLDTFNRAMDFMAEDIANKLSEMSIVMEETGGVISMVEADDWLAAEKATAIIEKFEKNGIEGLFSNHSFQTVKVKAPDPILLAKKEAADNELTFDDFLN